MVEKDPAHLIEGPKKSKPLPQFLRGQEPETAAARGTQVHRILELWDMVREKLEG